MGFFYSTHAHRSCMFLQNKLTQNNTITEFLWIDLHGNDRIIMVQSGPIQFSGILPFKTVRCVKEKHESKFFISVAG